MRQINKNFIKNKLLFYFPNWHKINSIKKKFSPEKLEELKKKGKIAMRNFKLKMMNNNSRIEKKKIEQMKSKQESMKMKRSISSLLLNNGAKLERKINLYINKNNIDEPKAKKINSINNKNNIRKKLINQLY